MLKLKWVGRYTAGALACFAYNRPVAFLATNIGRVVGSCFAGTPFPTPGHDAQLMAIAEQALPGNACYAWHQALMDLGTTVCTRTRPACQRCPLQQWCLAKPALSRESGNGKVLAVREQRVPYRT